MALIVLLYSQAVLFAALLTRCPLNIPFPMPNKQPSADNLLTNSRWKLQNPHELWVLAACLLTLTVCYWLSAGGHRGQLIKIDRASALEAKFLVDINRADWPEIIQLPGLGETLAQRVIAEREQSGPYLSVDDLDRVDGIGPKTLESLRTYLLPISADIDWATAEKSETMPAK